MNQKSTNLHFMRFIAAVMVIFSHSFPIVEGNNRNEWLSMLTKGQTTLGGLAVAVFFLCGGYLCAKSIHRYSKVRDYVLMKLTRLLPPLMFVVLCSVFVGGFLTNLSIKEYYSNPLTWRYLLNGVMILQHNLPGVFENASYLPTVNGSLWTLPVEFLCYLATFMMYKMSLLEEKKFYYTIPFVVLGGIVLSVAAGKFALLKAVVNPCILFYIGIFYYIYRDRIKFSKSVCCICGILLCIATVLGYFNIGLLIFFPYPMIAYWFFYEQRFKKVGKLGDYAYALYLWGFPVQQFVAWRFEYTLSPLMDAVISLPLAFGLSVITYHFVECPVNKYTKKVLYSK